VCFDSIQAFYLLFKTKHEEKKCSKCRSVKIKKNWKRYWRQRYLCKGCWFVWELWKWKRRQKPGNDKLLNEFVGNEVKYRQMRQAYSVSMQTIWGWMNTTIFEEYYYDKTAPQKIILLMDTTYFWREYGYMIFRAWFPDLRKWKNLLRYKVLYETNKKYREWYEFLVEKWREICGIVCDWRQWLLWWFWDIPTQMCVYHMKQIITRYLTKKPKLEQNKSLKNIADCIWDQSENDVRFALEVWNKENKIWLSEKNVAWNYIHGKTRKAYRSIKKKLSWCYTFVRHRMLWIPKTNNSLESINSHLKTKLWIHRWLKEKNKDTFTRYYLYIS